MSDRHPGMGDQVDLGDFHPLVGPVLGEAPDPHVDAQAGCCSRGQAASQRRAKVPQVHRVHLRSRRSGGSDGAPNDVGSGLSIRNCGSLSRAGGAR